MKPAAERVAGSFRDPAGVVFRRGASFFRQVNRCFAAEFDAVCASGIYDELHAAGMLVRHRSVESDLRLTEDAHAVLQADTIPFVSYPYEWCFGQIRDAALLTLDIQARALGRGLTLRDASAYNIQFVDGRPTFIDTLSFEPRQEGRPWQAYQQFCRHFLVPLALMSKVDIRCGQLLRTFADGIPLDLGAKLLPMRSRLNPALLFHVVLHAHTVRRFERASVSESGARRHMSTRALRELVDGLRTAIESLAWSPTGTQWAEYGDCTSYAPDALDLKRQLVRGALAGTGARTVWDLGANTGEFSREARKVVPLVVCLDNDAAAVERNYRRVRGRGETGLLPLLVDLTNPSAAEGLAGEERLSLAQRGPADAALALALVHHLAISGNVPLPRIAALLARLARLLVIEFVPKSDAQVQRLLRNRADIFPDYDREGFERAFTAHFRIERRDAVGESGRWLYVMTASKPPDS